MAVYNLPIIVTCSGYKPISQEHRWGWVSGSDKSCSCGWPMNHPGSLRDQDVVTSRSWVFQASALSGRHICFSKWRKPNQNRRHSWQSHKVNPCPLLPGFQHWARMIYVSCFGAILHSEKRTEIGTTNTAFLFQHLWNAIGFVYLSHKF